MPPSLATNRVSLRELADLAIGTPEVGAVNFTALHTLIVSMLKSLNLQGVLIDFHYPSAESGRSADVVRSSLSTPHVSASKEKRRSLSKLSLSPQTLESQVKDLGTQVLDLSKQIKNMDNKIQGLVTHVEHISTVPDLYADFHKLEKEMSVLAPQISPQTSPQISSQTSLTKSSTRTYESIDMPKSDSAVGMLPQMTQPRLSKTQKDVSTTRSTNVLQNLIADIKALKETQKMQESSELNVQELLQRVNELEKVVKDREEYLDQLNRRLNLVPGDEDITMVTWEELEQAISDGWKTSRGSSDSSTTTFSRRKMTSLTSSDFPSGIFPKGSTAGQVRGSIGGPEQILTSVIEHSPERIVSRDRTISSAGFRDLHPQARKPSHITTETDRPRMGDYVASTHQRRDGQQPGPTQQDLLPARDQYGGVPISQGQVYPVPDEHGTGPLVMDQPAIQSPGPYSHAVVPFIVGQLGVLPPEMDDQGLVPLGMDQSGVWPPSVPDRGQQGLGKPSTAQLATVPFSTYQQGIMLPRTDQHGMEQPVMYNSGLGPWDMDRQGLIPVGIDQHGFVILGTGQQGLVMPGIDQHAFPPSLPGQYALASPGLTQVSTDQQGFGQPSSEAPGFTQPGTEQRGMAQPGVDQRSVVPPGVAQPGVGPRVLMRSDADRRSSEPIRAGQQSLAQSVADRRSLGQPEASWRDSAHPGTGRESSIQPEADQQSSAEPGEDQRGLVQPGTDQHLVPLGADQPSLIQPGVYPLGLASHGAGQQGLVQPGTGQPVWVQPSTDQHGWVQPGAFLPGLVQPSVDQHALVQLGMDHHGLVQPGAVQHGLVQPDAHAPGLMQLSAIQDSLVQPEIHQRGFVQPGTDQLDMAQPGAVQPGPVQPGAVQPGPVQPGAVQPGPVQPGAVQHGLVQPGAFPSGWVQPETYSPGLVQPGIGQYGLVQQRAIQYGFMQPSVAQHGLLQPSGDQHGLMQPGMDHGGSAQPGADESILAQPGMGQQGLAQPGMDHRDLVQPGALQHGSVQLSVDQYGLAQPRVYQSGLVQPGVDQSGLAQSGVDQSVLAQPGVDQSGLVQPGVDQNGLVQPGVDQHGLVQARMYQYGFVEPGAIQPGAVQPRLVQPVMGHRGLVQPGAVQPRLVQPVMGHHGLVQPGAVQTRLVQPVMDSLGLMQPGAVQPRLVQPAMGHRGLAQSGAVQTRLVQPVMDYHGLMQPGIVQPRLVQPVMDQPSSVQPGMDQHDSLQPGADQPGLVQPSTAGLDMMQPGIFQPGAGPQGLAQPGVSMPSLALPGAYPPGFRQSITSQPGFIAPSTELHGFADSYQEEMLTPEQVEDEAGLPVLGHQGSEQQVPGAVRYDQTRAVLDYPGPEPTVDTSGQVIWDPSRKPAPVQFELATPVGSYHGTHDSRTQDLSYIYQVSSVSETRSERKESLEKLAPSFPIAVETFRLMGEIIGLYVELKEHMRDLDEEQAGQTDLEKIQYLLSTMVKKTIPQDLQDQLKSLKTLNKEVRQDKAKLEKIQKLLDIESSGTKDVKPSHLSLQLGILRVTVSDIEKELSELRESQERGKAAMENSVSEASLYLQDQLDKLRTIIESMLSSSSTLLSMSITPHKSISTLVPGQIDPETTCPACSLDVSHQVSLLVQRYEQLQDMVNGLAASRPSKKAKLQSQDEELLGHVQSAILQVQGDCEKLNITTSNLIEDHQQKQKDIEVLYQGIERLDKEKADREHLEMEIDVKADKSALASKVSRIQFDATTEQLNHMMQELVAKMSGQEQDWQKLVDKLLAEMDSKLDRLELDPVKQMLEDRWKSLRQQLKERSPLYQADEAAAMRRQLLAHFHCLSCDRPLETAVTGQVISMTPMVPSMPGHRSVRPYTVFELEQVRQQSRNLKLGGSFLRGDLSQMERSVGRLRSMHSKMLLDIEKVQIHFGGSVKASSQMIRELLHAQCLSHPCYKRGIDMADYTYSTVPRRCGGSHTLTYPYRRNRPQHLSPLEEIQIAMKHDEVDILGLDGHIYKGRMDTKLPGILRKDGPGMTKYKSKQLQQFQQLQQARPHMPRQPSLGNSGLPPSRPQSAQTLADTNPGQKKDRPLSSEGRLSQPNVAHSSSPTEMARLQGSPSGLRMHMGVHPGEGMEEPTRGPRSTPAH